MATHLDLEEQEQLEQFKHFWQQYGNAITWVLIAVLGAYAAWSGWNYWQRQNSQQAAGLFDEVDRAAKAGDTARVERAFRDMKERYAGTAYAQQAGLLAAKVMVEKGSADQARAVLNWVSEHAAEKEYQAIARLRLAAVLLDGKAHDEALKVLDADVPKEFVPLVADRRGDIYWAQGKQADAKAAYERAYKGLDVSIDYRRLVEAKLMSLGGLAGASAPAVVATEPKQ